MSNRHAIAIAAAIAVTASAAHGQIAPKAPEPATLKASADMAKTLPFNNRQDFDDAMRGFVGTISDTLVARSGPSPVWTGPRRRLSQPAISSCAP